MEYVSGLFCAANYSCVRCACVDDLDETDDFDRFVQTQLSAEMGRTIGAAAGDFVTDDAGSFT